MGAWGYKALESDEGLDVVDFIEDYITTGDFNKKSQELELSKLILKLKTEGFLGLDFETIDFYFDHSAMALTELYFMFKENGFLDYDHEEEQQSLKLNVKAFSADKDALSFLLRYLTDIKEEVPDEDGERELVELWKDSESYDEWNTHLNDLIHKLTSEIKELS